MKDFNLDAALNGEPVILRNGSKAIILNDLRNHFTNAEDCDEVLLGAIYSDDGNALRRAACWNCSGLWIGDYIDEFDIVGMWEEPELTPEQVLKTAYEKDLLVSCDGNPDLPLRVIAQTKDGDFIMQPENATIQPWIANLTMEWFFVGNAEPEFDTTSINLPKPFKPKVGEPYFYVSRGFVEYENEFWDTSNIDLTAAKTGSCFRTKEDAQKWLDFMKSMLE